MIKFVGDASIYYTCITHKYVIHDKSHQTTKSRKSVNESDTQRHTKFTLGVTNM